MVNEVSASALVCFTDRSCLPNPGPCGAGAVIYHPDGQEECIKRPVAAYGSIFLGELVAIPSVTEHLVTNNSQIQHREIKIFSDSSGYCLFDLILYVPSTIFQLYRDRSSWVEPVLS